MSGAPVNAKIIEVNGLNDGFSSKLCLLPESAWGEHGFYLESFGFRSQLHDQESVQNGTLMTSSISN